MDNKNSDQTHAFIAGLPSVVVVCGHYGVGKTNLSLNMAVDAARAGNDVCLVDLDVVNPYFRSSDYPELLDKHGIDLLAPHFARTALDAPMLSGRIGTEITRAQQEEGRVVIIDVGGDDAGATALGVYATEVHAETYAMYYVVNACREQTTDPHQAALLLPEIETASKCTATGIVNNTHLQNQTTADVVRKGQEFAEKVAMELQLPILCTTAPAYLKDDVDFKTLVCDSVYMVQEYVVTPWDA